MSTKIVKGRLVTVDNAERKFGSALNYIAIQVENEDGKGERCLLFTKDEIAKAQIRASKNPEDLTKKGFFTNLFD
jgi:hypothetical protein